VEQTIRSYSSGHRFSDGKLVAVVLDGQFLYHAKITQVRPPQSLGNLDADDAKMGGFTTIEELQAAAMRAGFRFRPLDEYFAYKIRFVPTDGP